MRRILLLMIGLWAAGSVTAQQNLIPNGDFSAADPLKGWRYDFPYQSRYVKNGSYIKVVKQLGRTCVELDLPPTVAGNEGGKIETALVPAVPGATYRAEVDTLTWDFSGKLHAEAYTTDPRPEGKQGQSLFVIPGTTGVPAKVMCWRAQFTDPPSGAKKWSTQTREFTLPATVQVAGKDCKPEFLVLKAVAFAGTMNPGKSYYTNFRLYRVK